MATYTDLYNLTGHTELRNRIAAACMVAAAAIIDKASPTSNEIMWAKRIINDPQSVANDIQKYLLAKSSSLTTAQILSVSDATIQTHVTSAITKLVVGGT